MAFNKDELKEITKLLQEQAKMQDHLNESMRNYTEHLKKIAEMQKNIKFISEQINHLKDEEKDLTKDLESLLKDRNKGTKDEINARRKEIKLIIDKIKAKRISVDLSEQELNSLKEINDQYLEQARNVNKVNLGLKEGAKFLKAVPGLINKGYGKFKGLGLFDIEKSAKMAALELGIVSKNTNGFRQNMYDTAKSTFDIGIHTKDLAKIQAQYSSELGASTQLSKEGFESISEIAKGTMLGVEGATQLAVEMQKFNISAADSSKYVEEIVKMSQKMGVNSNKVLKSLQNNLKLANKYHFKGGIAGMAKMAATAEKFRITMDATASMADKLFDIEGAVEMSAQLNTMGGEWAKLGDPMKLMFQARNDMEGLQDSVIQATAGMADFNKETGEFEFSGLELHRMRELEKITGISAENMAEMAKQKAKFSKVRGQMGGSGLSDEMMQFVEANAQFNKKSGKFEIKLEGSKKAIPVEELKKIHEGELKNTEKSLRERAEASQTFDDLLNDTIEQMKELLLPVLEGINDALPSMRKMVKQMMNSGLAEKISSAARTIGNIVGKAVKFLAEWPKLTVGIIATVLGGQLLWNLGKWFMNGVILGKGFMSVAGAGMMGGGGGAGMGMMGMGGGRRLGLGGRMMKGMGGMFGGKNTMVGRGFRNMSAGMAGRGMMGRMGMGGLGMMGLGMLGMAGSMGLDYGREQLDNRDSAGGKALGIGSSALSGAGIGFSLLGPVGGLIGGIIGGIKGAFDEFRDKSRGVSKVNDAVMADGKITPIDSKDKVFEISKPGGAYDKATNDKKGGTTTTSNVKIHISFDELKVSAGSGVGNIDLESDSAFMRELATKIKKSLSKTANGGVLSPNPS